MKDLVVIYSFAIILLSKRERERERWLFKFNINLAAVCSVYLPHVAMGWSAVCDCVICLVIHAFEHLLKTQCPKTVT